MSEEERSGGQVFVEDLLKHFIEMVEDYELHANISMSFESDMTLSDGRKLVINLSKEDTDE